MATAMANQLQPRARTRIDPAHVAVGVGLVAALAAAAYAGLVLAGRTGIARSRGVDLFAIAFLVGSAAPAWLAWRRAARTRAREGRLPDFLTDVASLHKAGLTLADSVVAAAEGEYGPLDSVVRDAADQIRWNLPVLVVLENLRRGLGTRLATRTFAVVIEAARTGGNVPEVLEIAAENARATVRMREARTRSMGLYTIITYVASLVFVGVALSMQTVFVPRMLQAFGAGAAGGIGLASSLPTADAFRTMFYAAALVQAIGNGIVGGIMSEGSGSAGLRHSWTMVALCAAGFALVP